MLRDDKSYVYILFQQINLYPRIASGRGKGKHQIGKFWSYPSAYNARDTLLVLQNYLMYANVKIAIFHSVNVRVCNIKLNAVLRLVWAGLGPGKPIVKMYKTRFDF